MENSHDNDFDIVDFDLNEYDEEFEKDEKRLQLKEERKIAREKSRTERAREQKTRSDHIRRKNEPNRDMLKTILLILIVIVIACIFLGFITFLVNSTGGSTKPKNKSNRLRTTTETEKNDSFQDNPSDESDADTQKKNL